MKQLETLEAWKCSQRLARAAYGLTLTKPLSLHYGLADQIRRSAVSGPANLVEGYALGTTVQFVRCLRIALGSTAELNSHLSIAADLGLLARGPAEEVIKLSERTIRLLIGLIRRLHRRRASPFPIPHSPFPIPRYAG